MYESCSFALNVSDPISYEEAAKQEVWLDAMKEELIAIERNHTWQLVTLPEGKKTIGLKWIFKTKVDQDGAIKKYKAWLVAKEYSQIHGEDFEETFSPVAQLETIKNIYCLWSSYEMAHLSA